MIPIFMIQRFVNPVANIEIKLYCEGVKRLQKYNGPHASNKSK